VRDLINRGFAALPIGGPVFAAAADGAAPGVPRPAAMGAGAPASAAPGPHGPAAPAAVNPGPVIHFPGPGGY
jgi:hypothetical protein